MPKDAPAFPFEITCLNSESFNKLIQQTLQFSFIENVNNITRTGNCN